MKISILTLFPEIIDSFFQNSIMAKAIERGIIEYEIINIRDFAKDKHKTCDDSPYGGGAGMVLKPEPLGEALQAASSHSGFTLYPSPSGKPLTQAKAYEWAKKDHIVLICGRYEGIDQRIIDQYVDEEVSIGDYVISSGEIASLVVIDSIYRLIDGVITQESLEEESFSGPLLEYPHYTRPVDYEGNIVPEVLRGGNHAKIDEWRHKKRLLKTWQNRPELLKSVQLSEIEQKWLADIQAGGSDE